MAFHDPVERRLEVALFPFALVVTSLARARAAKVESESREIRRLESARGAKNDLVVQRPAMQRMRMANHGDGDRTLDVAV
jgi:hypothetical protein